jgi:ribosomal protein L18
MIKQFNANKARLKRHLRMRNHLEGTQERPRLSVFRSGHHIYAQIIDDTTGKTLVSASSLEEALRDFKPAGQENASLVEKVGGLLQAVAGAVIDKASDAVEMAADIAPIPTKGKGARTEKAPQKPQGKGSQPQKGGKPGAQVKTVLPTAQKGAAKTPVEALAPIANNRKVAVAREVGKLVAQRAKEKGVNRVVFDRGGYAYHGRVAALAEGAREAGLSF